MSNNLDYINILKALEEIPFNVGIKLLVDFLIGEENNKSIVRNNLYNLSLFGSLAYSKRELKAIVNNLLLNNLIEKVPLQKNKFWKVLQLTQKGRDEINNPSLFKKKLSYNFQNIKTEITENDKKIFSYFGDFLKKFNNEQKKAIISPAKEILCVAGAGSGKTTVLTKRIEFLVKLKSINPKKILAITFTRKARQEMRNRLKDKHYLDEVKIETFNSFCEKNLRKYNDLAYNTNVRVISYRDKFTIMRKALESQRLDMGKAINIYFSYAQKRSKTKEQLARIFMNDCFFIRDYLKFKNKKITQENFECNNYKHQKSSQMMFKVCKYINDFMKQKGLRDFADQLIDAIELFKKNNNLMPKFDHVLIDEYQDINSTQIKLIDLLNPKNLFCVGDPRQSIYGWRGSDIKYILNFKEKYPNSEMITLTKNYRSNQHIVKLINESIKDLGFPDLEHNIEDKKNIKVLNFKNESSEFEFIYQMILGSTLPRNEIFVLARTNKQLNELSELLKQRKIKHIVKSDEMKRSIIAREDQVTLATIHSIKGMEAEMVFVIGCNTSKFPCRASEHPVIEIVKIDEYDKEEEERRLLYVAMSRAKKSLYLSYTGSLSYFITDNMKNLVEEQTLSLETRDKKENNKTKKPASKNLISDLKNWRFEKSQELNIPPYMIMHDKTINDLSDKLIYSIDDLYNVYGLGPAKIRRYGKELLDVING